MDEYIKSQLCTKLENEEHYLKQRQKQLKQLYHYHRIDSNNYLFALNERIMNLSVITVDKRRLCYDQIASIMDTTLSIEGDINCEIDRVKNYAVQWKILEGPPDTKASPMAIYKTENTPNELKYQWHFKGNRLLEDQEIILDGNTMSQLEKIVITKVNEVTGEEQHFTKHYPRR